MEKESCNCFTCRHSDEPRVVAGYLQGYIDACDWFINWAEKNKIKLGSIADNDLSGIYAQMKCNRDESGCLLKDFPDLEKPIKNNETKKPFKITESEFYKTKDGRKVYISWIQDYDMYNTELSEEDYICYGIFHDSSGNICTWDIFGKSITYSDGKVDIISKWED